MSAIYKKLLGITSSIMLGGLMIVSLPVFADTAASFLGTPYVTTGAGFSNVGNAMVTLGAGIKVNDWLRLEVDHRIFGSTSENGATQEVGPMQYNTPVYVNGILNSGGDYFCSPCHNENLVYDDKVSGHVISALFTTSSPKAFAYLRVGLMFRTDEITIHPIDVYTRDPNYTNSGNPNYTNAGPQTSSITSTEKIIGVGVSGHGFYAEITHYGSYPGIYINHDFYTSTIGYRMDF